MRLAMTTVHGPIATVLGEMFEPQARYASISLAYQIAGVIFGGMCALSAACLLVAPQQDSPSHAVNREKAVVQ